jgi:hypothetical protein
MICSPLNPGLASRKSTADEYISEQPEGYTVVAEECVPNTKVATAPEAVNAQNVFKAIQPVNSSAVSLKSKTVCTETGKTVSAESSCGIFKPAETVATPPAIVSLLDSVSICIKGTCFIVLCIDLALSPASEAFAHVVK